MTYRETKTYTAILTFSDQSTVEITFKSRGVRTSSVTSDARKAGIKAGYNSEDFNVFSSGIKEQT